MSIQLMKSPRASHDVRGLCFTKPKNFYLKTLKPKLNLLPIKCISNKPIISKYYKHHYINYSHLYLILSIPYLGKLKALVISAISSWLIPSGSNPIHFESI